MTAVGLGCVNSGPTKWVRTNQWRKRWCRGSSGGSRRTFWVTCSSIAFTRGRYATDASHYQIMPVGVVAPRSTKEVEHTLALAREERVSVLPRGGGTSQSGQTVNSSLVIDCSKYLDHVLELDVAGRRCVVEPGIVLDELNRRLRPHGLWFPVDISTASRATIGGMVGNNSCGSRSLRYGNTRENVLSIDAVLADGKIAHFGPAARDLSDLPRGSPLVPLARDLLGLAAREADEIEAHFPKVQRRVGGYNLDALVPGRNDLNLAHILVGSEGTLAFSTRIELKLSPLLGRRAVGACHFGSFARAMDAAQYIVKLGPIAVELVDRTMLGLAREIAHVQADDRCGRARRSRGHPVRGVRGRRAVRQRQPPDAAQRAHGRSRLRLGQDRRQMGRRDPGARSQAADGDHRDADRRPQHHDVDEG